MGENKNQETKSGVHGRHSESGSLISLLGPTLDFSRTHPGQGAKTQVTEERARLGHWKNDLGRKQSNLLGGRWVVAL